jgi:osmotically-inducible protein OsmY
MEDMMASIKLVTSSTIAAASLLALSLTFQTVPRAAQADTGTHVISGEVLKFDVGGYLIKDSSGRDVHIEVNEQTRMEPTPLVGDRIYATIAANGIAMSITKLKSPHNESAPQDSPTITRESSAEQSEADQNLRYRIEERLRTDGRIDWEVLEVEVKRGEATLYGEVQTKDQKGLASLIVTTVPGVAGVTNSIIVEPGPFTKDHGLQNAIWMSLRSVDALRQQTNRLTVQVKNQVATLSGTVERPLQKEAAEKAAQAVPGVEKVINNILVRHLERLGEREKFREQGIQQVP